MRTITRPVWVTITAIVAASAGFGFAMWVFRDSNSPGELLPAVLGPFFAILGTLAGAVAGQAAGAAGAEQAREQAIRAQDVAATAQEKYTALAERSDPNLIEKLKEDKPALFA